MIDAVDECSSNERVQLLDALNTIKSKSRDVVKIFISSRHETDIAIRLQGAQTIEVTQARIKDDLQRFLQNECRSFIENWALYHQGKPEDFQEVEKNIFDTLYAGSQGM